MKISYPVKRNLARNPVLSTSCFFVLIMALVSASLFMLISTLESYRSRNSTLETLGRVEKLQQGSTRQLLSTTQAWPQGSPVLEGETVTVASASLLQHIAAAVTRAEGVLVSSEMETQEQGAKDTYLKASATFEIEQPALQKLLYDVESGLPFLFVDQLVVYPPASDAGDKMRVLMQVSARWVGAK